MESLTRGLNGGLCKLYDKLWHTLAHRLCVYQTWCMRYMRHQPTPYCTWEKHEPNHFILFWSSKTSPLSLLQKAEFTSFSFDRQPCSQPTVSQATIGERLGALWWHGLSFHMTSQGPREEQVLALLSLHCSFPTHCLPLPHSSSLSRPTCFTQSRLRSHGKYLLQRSPAGIEGWHLLLLLLQTGLEVG